MIKMRRLGYFCVLTIFLSQSVLGQDPGVCSQIPDAEKIDCLPANDSPTSEECAKRKCCWKASEDNVKVSSCFYPPNYPGYKAQVQMTQESGILANCVLTNPSGFPGDAKNLRLTVEYLTADMLRIRLVDPDKKRFEPPVPEIPRFPRLTKNTARNYDVTLGANPLSIKVVRKSNNATIFDTSVGALSLADQFLEISTRLSTIYLYGIGEHSTGNGIMRGGVKQHYPLFNRGELVRAGHPGFNLYGSHPFFVNLEKDGQAHGVYLLNSAAMDIVTYESPLVTYRPIGGIFDFFVFLGPQPDSVVAQYTSVIGRPFFPPYWSLGFHLCRYQYNSTAETRKIWKQNVDAGIYFEGQWSDIDYMEDRKCFTYDKVNYAGLPEFVQDVHDADMHYMMITDPGLDATTAPGTYLPTDEARQLDLLIKDANGDVLEGLVWQDRTVFVDFTNPKSEDYWIRQFKRLHDEVPYDGSWIDMNEPYSFINGSHKGCPEGNTFDYPPFVPGKDILFNGTICMSAKQHIGEHYYAHNLYGFQEGIYTNKAMALILKKRPFILSRATFPGYGKYGAHWLGDVWSRWEYMEDSIERMHGFNLYGIPMIGTDICGFTGNTTLEMCMRWTALGAFYPFARNHNDKDTIAQDPVSMGPDMVELHTKVFEIRYYLLPHLYTLLYHSHAEGVPTIRHLAFEYPTDTNTYKIKNTFLWGRSLLFIPVLEQGKTSATAYIPKGVWYDYYTGEVVPNTGSEIAFDAPIDKINILIKGGNVIPAQDPAIRIAQSRKNKFALHIALDENGKAKGDLYWDDGDSIDSVTGSKFNFITFDVSNHTLHIRAVSRGYETEMILERVLVLGVPNPVSYATLDRTRVHTSYDLQSKALKIDLGAGRSLLEDGDLTWY